MPSFEGATGWLNSGPLSPGDLRGKVVVVDFWTFSCANWLRTEPYVRAWADKYRELCLVMIGVHTPEFSFERETETVRWAAQYYKISYPVAIDSDYEVWQSFSNNYWPALYFIDAEGHIRHHHFGEGGYEQSEAAIQALLEEAGRTGFDGTPVSVEAVGPETPANWAAVRSPESYVGAAKAENFASPGGAITDKPSEYAIPERLRLNHWALAGLWQVGDEAIALNGETGRIAYRFHARDANLVMGPPPDAPPVRFRVLIDGKPPGDDRGTDTDPQGYGLASEQRLYQLVRQRQPIRDRTFEIEFLDPGLEAFVFTFG
jgi:thiol-disulfide isomerase/thioredoxin